MGFSDVSLEHIADGQSFLRGREYYEAGNVRDVRFLFPSSKRVRVTGTVNGTTRYRTSMEVDLVEDAVVFYSCSCPYDRGGACKHVVALGFAAIDSLARQAVDLPEENVDAGTVSDAMTDVLRKFFKERGVAVNDEETQKLIGTLSRAKASPSDVPLGQPPVRVEHELDGIQLRISYDASADTLEVSPRALYGPISIVPGDLFVADSGEAPTVRGKKAKYRLMRDHDREDRCVSDLDYALRSSADAQGVWHVVGGEALYRFVTEVYPDISLSYEPVLTKSAEHLFNIGSAEIDTDWKTSVSVPGLMDFEVAWHCAGAGITEKQLTEMMNRKGSYLRLADGSFVEPENADEIVQLVEMVRQSEQKKDGKFTIEMNRAPEMLALIARTENGRVAAMDARLKTFLQETQTGKPVEEVVIPAHLATILRPYQKRGVEWGMFLRKHGFGGILADDMGLGKTLQVLALLSVNNVAAGEEKRPSIVVCPKTLIGIWMKEAATFTPGLKTLAIDGSAGERAEAFSKIDGVDLVVTSYPCLLRDIDVYVDSGIKFDYCIIDEAQYVKNGETSSAKAVKRIPATNRLALSGTPLENGVHELWSIFDFLMPGFLGDKRDFGLRFARPIHEKHDKRALSILQAKIKPFVLRRTKATEAKELPPKIEQLREYALTPTQIALYADTLENVRRDVLEAVEHKGFARSRIEILSALMRLRQVCCHPALVAKGTSKDPELSGKLPHALELIDEAVSGGHKVLLFSSFTGMLDIIRDTLNARSIGHCTIEGKTRDRDEQIRKFCEDPNANVFLLSLKAGGVGLTLTAADTVILFDPWWNPMAENQAMDRAHRIGQTKTVNVYKLISKGTIEERVLELQKRKKALFDALMTENGEGMDALTWDDVRGLFEL